MRRKTTNALLGLTGLLAILVGTMAPQDANAGNQVSPVGSWIVEVTPDTGGPPPFTNLATLFMDGNLTNSDSAGLGCHGVWERMGGLEIATFFVCLDGSFTIAVSSDPMDPLIISPGGDEMDGGFTTVVTNPDGSVAFSFSGQVMLTRITLPGE